MKLFCYFMSIAISVAFAVVLVQTAGWGIWVLSIVSAVFANIFYRLGERV